MKKSIYNLSNLSSLIFVWIKNEIQKLKKFRATILTIFFICSNPSISWASKTFIYETFDKNIKIGTATMIINDLNDKKQIEVDWIIEENQSRRDEKYFYDNDFVIQSWTVEDLNDHTAYEAMRQKDLVILKGTLKGQKIDQRLNVKGLPLYANPKIGLMKAFAMKGKNVDFWAIRNDSLSKAKMVAMNLGTDMLLINGKMERAHKIYWKSKIVPDYFFNRTYWFRESDGMFVGQEGSNKKSRKLIKEF